ncbi:hypothetical protein HMPREF9306_00549 [Propionimicrobium lymphophilum ACS-093-V-SCH5]|uniref:Atypical Rib domain-containing protein n=2 Tax=Propionimicrobium TaxID=203133 RepID=S2W3W2_9ACTN|nr:hypothetical protein HMPREF9306_00549 [Propionimicrobium lymphophilum ACS-093-V-SCH5]
MLNFKNEASSFLAANPGRAVRKFANFLKRLAAIALVCVLGFTLSSSSLANAEDQQIGSRAGEQSVNPTLENTPGDGLEIGPEIIGQPVRGTIPAPTIGKVFYDATTISGGNVQRKRVKGVGTVRSTVYVTLKDKEGNVKATVSVTPTSGTTWKVDLPNNTKVAAGDTVTAYQTLDGATSDVVTANAEPSMASQTTLTMPTGEIWIEKTNANLVNKDEQAEAVEMLKKANPSVASKFKEVKFSIDGTDHAYYEVTYTDGSTSGKIEATDLKIKTVTETSAAPTIEKVRVTDGQIIVTLANEVAQGTKFYYIQQFTDGEEKIFSQDGKCTVEKSNSQEMSQAVSIDGKTVTFPIDAVKDLELGRTFGVIVKEPHKFNSCAKSEPVLTTPDKVAVRDPHKLTDDDKKAIDKAIRDANTVNGVSKLPDGTGFVDVPAFIEFDKDGNVTITSPNDVESNDWDSDGNPIYEKNPDGTYKLKDGAKVTKFPVKDLVKNLKPDSPKIAVNTDDGKVTITPPPYENAGEDTGLLSYTVTYKDAGGNDKTITATRDLDTNKWSGPGVNEESGVITLSVEKIEVGGTITATAKDNGGLEGDTDKLDSDPESKPLETATVSYDANKGTGKMDGKTLNKGSKYTILDNVFSAPSATPEFKTWEIDGKEVAPGTEITVTKDTVVKALWKAAEQKIELKVDPNEVTIVKGSPMLKPMNVEAHSTSVGGDITLQTICLPNHDGAANTDNQSMPSGVELMEPTQDETPPTGYKARATAKIDGNANKADVGTYRCWVYANLNGITIDANGNATGSGTTQAAEGVNWARQPITVHVVEFVLPKTGVLSLNYVAGYAALLIVALTGVGYLRQNRREKSTA